jgi:hypothetical protein
MAEIHCVNENWLVAMTRGHAEDDLILYLFRLG